MERQKHGFLYEDKYIQENNLIKEDNYTSEYDAYDVDGNCYQIKTIKKGSGIDLGDIFRNANKKNNFFLVVAFWQGSKSNIVKVEKLYIDKNIWNEILDFDKYDELKEWIQSVSNDYSYDNQWKKERLFWKKEFGNRKINIRFKRDHKSQKRIQCSINYKVFYSYFVKEFSVLTEKE